MLWLVWRNSLLCKEFHSLGPSRLQRTPEGCVQTVKWCSHSARHRTTALDALTLDVGRHRTTQRRRTMSYDSRTTSCDTDAEIEPSSISESVSLRCRTSSCGMWTPPLNQCVQFQRHLTSSNDIVRCRTMSCAVWIPLKTARRADDQWRSVDDVYVPTRRPERNLQQSNRNRRLDLATIIAIQPTVKWQISSNRIHCVTAGRLVK